MTPEMVVSIGREALTTVLLVASPMLLIALIVIPVVFHVPEVVRAGA